MKRTLASVLQSGRAALAAAGIVVLGIGVLGSARALARNEATAAPATRTLTYAALAEAPEKARERKNPFQGDLEAVAAGGKLFEQHCAGCHGRKAGGARRGPSLLREEVQQATPGTLFWILTNGVVRRGMPVWSKLPEPERWQIVTFLHSLKLQPPLALPMNAKPINPEPVKAEPAAPVQHIP